MESFPRTTVGGISLPRMIIGTNWMLGWSHTGAAADAAIQEVEFRAKSGEILNKRETAIAIVQASCAASGLDISTFTDQLVKYIDDCVGFVNGFNKAAADGEKLAKKK